MAEFLFKNLYLFVLKQNVNSTIFWFLLYHLDYLADKNCTTNNHEYHDFIFVQNEWDFKDYSLPETHSLTLIIKVKSLLFFSKLNLSLVFPQRDFWGVWPVWDWTREVERDCKLTGSWLVQSCAQKFSCPSCQWLGSGPAGELPQSARLLFFSTGNPFVSLVSLLWRNSALQDHQLLPLAPPELPSWPSWSWGRRTCCRGRACSPRSDWRWAGGLPGVVSPQPAGSHPRDWPGGNWGPALLTLRSPRLWPAVPEFNTHSGSGSTLNDVDQWS